MFKKIRAQSPTVLLTWIVFTPFMALAIAWSIAIMRTSVWILLLPAVLLLLAIPGAIFWLIIHGVNRHEKWVYAVSAVLLPILWWLEVSEIIQLFNLTTLVSTVVLTIGAVIAAVMAVVYVRAFLAKTPR